MFVNGQQNVKIANVFFRANLPLYGIRDKIKETCVERNVR